MKNRISLKDIAENLNLSINTVSRGLHNRSDISEKTKELIRRKADELGYIPDSVASSMRTMTTKAIGVVFDNLRNPYFMMVADIINQYMLEKGFQIMIFTVNQFELTMDTFRKMISRRVDGVITFLKPESDVAKFANDIHLPMIVIGREANDINIDSIYTDDRSGGYAMGEYFFEQGYRNVAYLGGPEIILCNKMRAEGFSKYFTEKGLQTQILYSKTDEEIIHNLESIIGSGTDAVFCFNDSIAFSLIMYMKENYPSEKIEVSGYDNIASHMRLPIHMATVGTDVDEMVKAAITQILKRINKINTPLFDAKMPTYLIRK